MRWLENVADHLRELSWIEVWAATPGRMMLRRRFGRTQ